MAEAGAAEAPGAAGGGEGREEEGATSPASALRRRRGSRNAHDSPGPSASDGFAARAHKRRSYLLETNAYGVCDAPTLLLGDLPPAVARANEVFQTRHARATKQAGAMLVAHRRDPTSVPIAKALGTLTADVARNRLVVGESYDPFRPKPASLRPAIATSAHHHAPKWRLEESVWEPRKRLGNTRDFFETIEGFERMFAVDWEFARQGHGLEKFILRNDDRGDVWIDQDGNGTHDEVDEVRDTLFEHHRAIYGAFDYYACMHSAGDLTLSACEADVFNINLNAYLEWTRDCALASKSCGGKELEVIWVQVNAVERKTKDRDKHNKLRAFNRQEFLQAIVRIAMQKYVASRKFSDMSDALDHMLRVDLLGRLPAQALQNSNAFRMRACYTREVDAVLRRRMPSLRSIYRKYSEVNQDLSDALNSTHLMSVGEWLALLEHLGLFASGQLTAHEARMVFLWSRLRAASDASDVSEVRLRHLFFEDFMEALVRLSTMVALPTDAEVRELGAKDAGEFLLTFEEKSPSQFRAMVERRKQDWTQEPKQGVARCLEHLLSYVVRVIELSVVSNSDSVVQDAEVRRFVAGRGKSNRLSHRLFSKSTRLSAMDESHFAAAVEEARAKLLGGLRKVSVFSELSEAQLELLADSMTETSFGKGEWVFEQGDKGDKFYIIIEGDATVVRLEGAAGRPQVLAELHEGAYFGERALLKNETRYAGIRANSALRTMAISRERFEDQLGPLRDLVPERG